MENNQNQGQNQEDIAVDNKIKTEPPKKYRVLLHNDDYTTMEFVVAVLIRVFHKTHEEAQAIMMNVHKNGVGVCGVYIKEVAEVKVLQVHRFAKQNKQPLKCTTEPE